ncbi:MAG: hypothetical protein JXB07_03525 [Anaerolineae bacterium]|nr:hypothetical protein [Anaerolineae bacterium]
MFSSMLKTRQRRILLILISLVILSTFVGNSVALARPDKYQSHWFSGYQSRGAALGTLPAVNGGIPGLSGFRFNFKGGDHHFGSLVSTFDSPGVVGCCSGSWYTKLSDYNSDDAYWYDIRWQELPPGITYGSGGESVKMDGQEHWITIGHNYTLFTRPVLTGFKISGDGRSDSHLERISILLVGEARPGYGYPEPIMARVRLGGGGADKSVRISYALVPTRNLSMYGYDIKGTSSNGNERTGTLSAGNPVLLGFDLRFKNGAHHVDRVGVEVWPFNWRVTFEDHNHDDPYEYAIYYDNVAQWE